MKDKYDNVNYWIDMHKKYKGSIKAVGRSNLSEEYNKMKYQSEAETVLKVLEEIKNNYLIKKLSHFRCWCRYRLLVEFNVFFFYKNGYDAENYST